MKSQISFPRYFLTYIPISFPIKNIALIGMSIIFCLSKKITVTDSLYLMKVYLVVFLQSDTPVCHMVTAMFLNWAVHISSFEMLVSTLFRALEYLLQFLKAFLIKCYEKFFLGTAIWFEEEPASQKSAKNTSLRVNIKG